MFRSAKRKQSRDEPLSYFQTASSLALRAIFFTRSLTDYLPRAEALAASSVKIQGRDVMATWKILVSAGLAPLFYTFYTIVFLFLHKNNHLYGHLNVQSSTLVIVLSSYSILSLITHASLVFGEQGMDLLKSLYPLVLSVSPWSSHSIETLKEDRSVLVLRVRELVHQFGPELFPDCEDVQKWKGRAPMSLYAKTSPEAGLEDIEGLDDFF